MANKARVATILSELDRAARDYSDSRQAFEIARQTYEAAREKFISVRKLVPDVVPPFAWYMWQSDHPELAFVGLDIGGAILTVLRNKAIDSAMKSDESGGQKPYSPWMALWQITDALDVAGFEFQSGTPRREVHGALLKLKGVSKKGERYAVADHEEIMASIRESTEIAIQLADENVETTSEEAK